jgi:hypothetical protein
MTFETQISDLATDVATEINTVRAERLAITGALADLDTVTQVNLVAAINEVFAAVGAGGAVNLDGLSDVVVASHALGRILRSDGTNFVDVDGATIFDAAGAAGAAQAAAIAASQPVSANLTSLAGQANTAYGRALLNLANQAGLMALLSAASEATAGIVPLASNAEAVAGANTTKAVTPAGLAAGLAALVAAAPGTLDTLDEIAAALGDDPNFAATISTALGNRLRVDAAQGLSAPQKQQARDNIDVYSKAELGNPDTNFVNIFRAALV